MRILPALLFSLLCGLAQAQTLQKPKLSVVQLSDQVYVHCSYGIYQNTDIVVWLPNQQILHGGCFVKSVAAFGMGNIADANLTEWATSVRRVMNQFGTAKTVVPGHEEWGDTKSLEHTLRLLEKHAASKR